MGAPTPLDADIARVPLFDRIARSLSLDPDDRRHLLELALIFVALVATTYLVGYVAWKTWGVPEGSPTSLIHSVFDRWDVLNYALIAEHGYRVSDHHASWFPAMPAIMRVGHWFGLPYWLSGTGAVIGCAAVLTVILYKLVRLDCTAETSRDATLLMLISPSSVFLFVPYTESIFLMLVVGSFYCARKRNWAAAAALAGLASGVRSAGMFLLPALILEYMASLNWQVRQVRPDAAWLALAPTGLVLYMIYCEIRLDDALAFYHALDRVPHAETIAARDGFPDFIGSLMDDVRVIWLSHSPSEVYANSVGLGGLIVFGVAFLGMLYYRMRASYIVFSLLAAAASLPVGRLESANRYVVAAFPMFIVFALALQRWPVLRTPYVTLSLALFYLSVMRFATFEWAG